MEVLDEPLVVAEAPGVDEKLVGVEADLLLRGGLEELDLDRQLAAEIVEEDLADRSTQGGSCGDEQGLFPQVGVGAEGGDVAVLDGEQAALLEVRGGEAPAAGEVAVERVAEDAAEGALGRFALAVEDLRVLGVEADRQVEGLEDFLREFVVREFRRRLPARGRGRGRIGRGRG
jgi:hypothetical protein